MSELEQKEPQYGIYCHECNFESYRGLPEKLAIDVAECHTILTSHQPEIYEIDFHRPLGYFDQFGLVMPKRMTQEEIIDLSA